MSEATFDLRQAQELLPRLEQLLRAAIDEKGRLSAIGRKQAKQIERIVMAGGSLVNIAGFSRWKQHKEQTAGRLREVVEQIEELGCIVKDLDMGLIDFPCRVGGREFYLCWKLGESSIQFWHNMDEGFAGRKPIDEKLIQLMQRSCAR
jgi:hypothetical protein